jgi:hypothetical protein
VALAIVLTIARGGAMNAIRQVCLLLVVILRRIDLIDLLFLALAFFSPQPPLIALLALQAIGRRYWRVAVGLLQIAGVEEIKEWHCNVLPGATALLPSVVVYEEEEEDNNITSSGAVVSPSQSRSSFRTDDGRTETTAHQNRFTEQELLTLYGGLRAQGMTRDAATRLLKASGIPMNNNLWARAAPPEDDMMLTPIAGRPTRAAYYESDPALQYQEPPK